MTEMYCIYAEHTFGNGTKDCSFVRVKYYQDAGKLAWRFSTFSKASYSTFFIKEESAQLWITKIKERAPHYVLSIYKFSGERIVTLDELKEEHGERRIDLDL